MDQRTIRGFGGPLFIVGHPRSGTKLLRTLLNEHPRIAIPISEPNFIPDMVCDFGDPPRLHLQERLDKFYLRFSESVFFDWRRKHNVVMSKSYLCEHADLNSWASVFETVLRFYAPKKLTKEVIWGGKSPSYFTKLQLLKSVFPSAKFLHIIRDPRDVCLSMKKTWGKSLYRTAEIWREEVAACRLTGARLGEDYQEVMFESLLEDPGTTLWAVCNYLKVDFRPTMTNLSVSHEDRGDAKGLCEILRDNKEKYRFQLSVARIRRIEEIVYPTAVGAGYRLECARRFKPLGSIARSVLQCHDGAAMVKFYASDKSVGWAAKYLVRSVRRRMLGTSRGHVS